MLVSTKESWPAKRREATREAILAAAWETAREHGLAGLTLREVAARVGMRAPSLYSHFDSKHAIYDAMFGAAWRDYLQVAEALVLPVSPRAALRLLARTFFDFAAADHARHQLMNLRTIPGFAPSPQNYAPAVQVIEGLVERLREIGLRPTEGDVDLFTAIVGGLIDAQWANDPGGDRWARLLDRAVDMYADALHLPEEMR